MNDIWSSIKVELEFKNLFIYGTKTEDDINKQKLLDLGFHKK